MFKVRIEMACIGIDLGTTNCCVAYSDGENVKIIENELGRHTTPSIICYKKDGNKLFGESAKSEQTRNMQTTFYDIKRIIGRKMEDGDVASFISKAEYIIANHKKKITFLVNESHKNPEEISALLLAHLKQQSELRLDKEIDNVVITVPTHFNDSQRKATIDAGKIAGFKKVQLLNEPTAAAIEYGISNNINDGRVILVYDFGGGTFDVSIIKYSKNRFEVLAVDGDVYLGGRDIDNKLFEVFSAKYNIKFNGDSDKRKIPRLLNLCENIKIGLTTNPEVSAELLGFNLPDDEIVLNRADFDKTIQPILDKTMQCVDNCLAQDKVKDMKIDDILLVGGSSRILKIKSMIKDKFNKEPKQNINPDECVAAGAAIYSARLYDNKFPHLVFVDVCPFALGVETDGGIMSVIIPKHSPLPATKSKLYKTAEDNQTTIQVKIYSGNAGETKNNNYLGLLEVSGIASGPKGRTLRETFNVDLNGILNVTAEDHHGKSKYLTIYLDTGNLTENEVKSYNRELQQEISKAMDIKQFDEMRNSLRDSLKGEEWDYILKSVRYSLENKKILEKLSNN